MQKNDIRNYAKVHNDVSFNFIPFCHYSVFERSLFKSNMYSCVVRHKKNLLIMKKNGSLRASNQKGQAKFVVLTQNKEQYAVEQIGISSACELRL